MLNYPYDVLPAPGETIEIQPGLHWLRMPLPMALDHINLYLLEDTDGWWIVDTGMSIGPTQELWETIFSTVMGDKPVKALNVFHPIREDYR